MGYGGDICQGGKVKREYLSIPSSPAKRDPSQHGWEMLRVATNSGDNRKLKIWIRKWTRANLQLLRQWEKSEKAWRTEMPGYTNILQRNCTNISWNVITAKDFLTIHSTPHFETKEVMPRRFLHLFCTVDPLAYTFALHTYIGCTACRPLFRTLFSNAK